MLTAAAFSLGHLFQPSLQSKFLPADCYTVERERKWEAMWDIDLLSAPLKSWNKGEPLSKVQNPRYQKKKSAVAHTVNFTKYSVAVCFPASVPGRITFDHVICYPTVINHYFFWSSHQEECSRPQEEEDIMDIPLDDPEANRAAAKIQAGFRGHMTRKKMKPEDKVEGEEVSSTGDVLNGSQGDTGQWCRTRG